MTLRKDVQLSRQLVNKIGIETVYRKLKFVSYFGDDYIQKYQEIPDEWNCVIVKMYGHAPALVPRDMVKEYRDYMLNLFDERYFWGITRPQVFEIKDYK